MTSSFLLSSMGPFLEQSFPVVRPCPKLTWHGCTLTFLSMPSAREDSPVATHASYLGICCLCTHDPSTTSMPQSFSSCTLNHDISAVLCQVTQCTGCRREGGGGNTVGPVQNDPVLHVHGQEMRSEKSGSLALGGRGKPWDQCTGRSPGVQVKTPKRQALCYPAPIGAPAPTPAAAAENLPPIGFLSASS